MDDREVLRDRADVPVASSSRPQEPSSVVVAGATQRKNKDKKKRKGKKRPSQEVESIDDTSAESIASALWSSYSTFAEAGGEAKLQGDFLDQGAVQVLGTSEAGLARRVCMSFPEWRKEMSRTSANGSPMWIIVCSSADRCIAVLKELSDIRKFAKFGKLFSRHMKVPEQVSFLERSIVNVVVGTPARILKLCDLGNLKLGKAKVLFFDKTADMKNRSLLTMKDVQKDLWTFYEKHVQGLVAKGQVKVCVL